RSTDLLYLAIIYCSSFFFILFRQPQRSTLFPYTTLFRSVFGDVARGRPGSHRCAVEARRHVRPTRHVVAPALQHRPHPGPVLGQDRKSTRLNSSHVKISYAVFCLKKKKITTLSSTQ